jgi:hypothetical protein
MNISRRTFAALVPASLLAACGVSTVTNQPGTALAQVLNDFTKGIATTQAALTGIEVANPKLISTAVAQTLATYLADASSVLQTITTSLPPVTAANNLTTAFNYLNSFLNGVASIAGVLPSPFGDTIAALAFIAPEIEDYIASVVTPVAATSSNAASLAKLSSPRVTTIQQARALLGSS